MQRRTGGMQGLELPRKKPAHEQDLNNWFSLLR